MPNLHNEHSRDWAETLRSAVASRNEIGVARVFSALALNDGQQIEARAHAFLADVAPYYFAENDPGSGEMLEHRLRMDLFRETVLAYLEGKEADVEQAVEHDIETWIEANAPAVASANLRLMESALGEDGTATHRDVVRLHQLLDLETFERVQQRALEQAWSGIEVALAEVLAVNAR